MYFFAWNSGDSFSFGFSQKIVGHVPWDTVEYLTSEEVGQELGGN